MAAANDPHLERIRAARRQFETARDRAQTHAHMGGSSVFPRATPLSVDSIPGYEIGRELHRGGQGVVYEAVQQSTHRAVAIKVLHGGAFFDPRSLPRFEREVHILSQLHHPNVVTVHDSGVANGCAYFVMDLVTGVPLDAYVAARDRDVRTTLELFARVCDAVNAAHLRGVIHRDLKPANILIDPSGEPHVVDFGLAKVSEYDVIGSDGSSAVTLTGQFVGSLPWASPEQAAGEQVAVDTRTDVYALGVVLYHALTGQYPYRVSGPLRNVLDSIMTDAPARPSAVRRQIDNEVETIILKCLAKAPERRYQSAGELARDVRNYLSGDPVDAKRDSAWYVLRKTLRRHWVPTAVAGVFVVLIAVSAVAMSILYGRADRARESEAEQRKLAEVHAQAARRSADEAGAVNQFLQNMLAAADPRESGPETTLREVLDEAALTIGDEFGDRPLVEARLRATIGETYRSLGEYPAAETHLERALALQEQALGASDRDTLLTMNQLSSVYMKEDRTTDALALRRRAAETSARAFGDDDVMTMSSWANVASSLTSLGRYAEAESILEDVAARCHRVLGDENVETLGADTLLASVYRSQGRFAEAEPLFVSTLAARQRTLGHDDPRTLVTMDGLCGLYFDMGRYADAAPLAKESLAVQRRILGDDHPNTIRAMSNLASQYTNMGREDEAEALFNEALERARRVLGPEHSQTLILLNQLGALYEQQQRLDLAEKMHTEGLAARRRKLGNNHPDTLISINNLAGVYQKEGRLDLAEPLFAEAADIAARVLPESHWFRGGSLARHASCLVDLGRYEEAEPLLLKSYEMVSAVLGDEDVRTKKIRTLLVKLYTRWGKPECADEWRDDGIAADDASKEAP